MVIDTGSKTALFSKQAASAVREAEDLLKRIGETDNPAPLVQKLAPHDLLVTWKTADDEQRIDLLRLADKEQVTLMIDLICWPSYRPDLESLEDFIKPLALSGVGGAQRALDVLDDELRTLLLKQNAKVHVLENRNDDLIVPDTSELMCCPDGFYHIEFPDPEAISDLERSLYSALLMRPFESYQKELECVRQDLVSELEENALRWREGRLADYGFTSREEALQLITPRSPEEVRRLAALSELPNTPTEEIRLPSLVRDNLKGNQFLDAVFETLLLSKSLDSAEDSDTLTADLGGMINRFISATGVDMASIDSVSQAAAWARDLLALGLFETAEGDVQEGARLLGALHPGLFLQVGLYLVYPLRDRARSLLSDERLVPRGRRGSVLDPLYRTSLNCFSREIPCHWPGLANFSELELDLTDPPPDELVAFSSPDEISRAELLLDEIQWLPALLFDGLKCRVPLLRGTPTSVFVLTALANAAEDRPPTEKPVLRDEAMSFVARARELTKEDFLRDALKVLAPLLNTSAELTNSDEHDPLPARRLLVRLIRTGYSHLQVDSPDRVLIVENI